MKILKRLNKKYSSVLKKIWKPMLVVMVGIFITLIASKFAAAESVRVFITGDQLNDGTWQVGSENVTWTAVAKDSEINEDLSLEDGGSIIWESSDRNIVDISQSSQGSESTVMLKPVSAGQVTITAKYSKIVSGEDGDYEVTAQTQRTVVVKFNLDSTRLPQSPYEDNYNVPTILTNSDTPVKWVSSNENVVTVSDDGSGNGILSLQGAGKATITATTNDGQKASFPVVVNARFMENTSVINVNYNDYYTLTTNAKKPSDIHFISGNDKIASVDKDGSVKGVSAGKTFIYTYTVDQSDPWYDLQPDPIRSVGVNVKFDITESGKNVGVGDFIQLNTNIDSESKNNVNWTSSDTSVATVDTNGKVTAIKKGNVTITASVINESIFGTTDIQNASVNVNVIDSFALSESEHVMNVSDTFNLTALVTDNNASVSWTSSNESVVKVSVSKNDKFGATVTGISKGTAVITATQTVDGVNKSATCEVSIKEPVLNVQITPSEMEIVRGSQYRLTATFTPSMPDNMNVTWNSSDTSIVTVDNSGLIKGIKGGQAVISVVTEDGIKVANCTVKVREPVTSVKLSTNSVITGLGTKTYQLTYTITPDSEGVNKEVIWTSSAPDVATVNENGLVTFVKPGKATIIVKTVDIGTNGNLIDTCDFHINNPVTAVDLDYTSVTLKLGEQFRLTALITPNDATNKNIIWSSSDTSVVTINENGMLTAVGSGAATVLAKSEDSGATSMCNVIVYQPVTSINISNTEMTVRKGTQFWLNATALPENAMNKAVTWASSDESIAKVDANGKVDTLHAGNCVITATSQDSGVMAKCTLTVLQPIDGIYLNTSQNTIMKGDRFVVIPTITPADASNKNVTFTSSDTSVATVDAEGVVTGVKGGRAVIIVKTEERGLIASCLVTVQEFVSSVTMTKKISRLNLYTSGQLQAQALAESATNKTLNWQSSNGNIIAVDSKGMVSALTTGRATVYAFATDGSGLYDTCDIEVINPVNSVVVSPSTLTITQGKIGNLSATVSPSNATYRDIEWTTSDPAVAIVNGSGEITGISAGICKIYAISTDGNSILGACNVTVKPIVAASGVTINSKSITMLPGQSRVLNARLKPSKSTESVYWVSGDTSVATVSSNGTVVARGQGQTEIYAITNETGVESSCEVIVLAMNATYISLEQYDSYDLDVFGSTEKIKWYTSNKRVATISSSGKVVGRMAGTATITAKVNGKVLHCTVHVSNMN